MAFGNLLLAASLPLAIALRRAGPDPNIPDDIAVVLDRQVNEASGNDTVTEMSTYDLYKSLPPTQWTAYQIMEEMTTNFTASLTFQDHLEKWCGSKAPDTPCGVTNRITHYCPSLFSALNYTLNRSELVSALMDALSTTDIWSKAGLKPANVKPALLQVSTEQRQSWPWQRKNKTNSENVHTEQHVRLGKKKTPSTTPQAAAQPAHKAPKQDVLEKMLEARRKAEATQLAIQVFLEPFPEVTKTELYEETAKQNCLVVSKRKMQACVDQAKMDLICLIAGKVAFKFFDVASLSEKMQVMLQERPELHFQN